MKIKSLALSVTAAALLVGCTTNPGTPKSQSHTVSFEKVTVPMTDKEKREVRASSWIEVDGKRTEIGFHTIHRSGDVVGGGTYGMLYDAKGNTIKGADGYPKISNSNEFSSLIPIGDKLFMVSQFETRPAAMYISELEQSKDGKLTAVSTRNIDMSSVNGLWVPCAGVVTPWNTHLSSEEYEPNAAKVKRNGSINSYYDAMADYFGGDLKALNPYDYGWTPEVIVLNEKGETKVVKHYSMGRFAHELAYVMPDEKTVYLSDDGTNVGLFMFVADNKGDLSSGKLYAAKWEQRSNKGAGSADIKWVDLGHSSNRTIKKALDKKVKFKDIFDSSKVAKKGYTTINTTNGLEHLKLKPGMEEIASRLETRRYAAMKGATTEFRKMEGITFNKKENILYVAMSSIGKGMEDNKKKGKSNDKYDKGGNNDIQLSYNPCGAVYGLNMITFSKPHATNGSKIDSKYVSNSMYSVIEGKPEKSKFFKGNKCSVNGIANPDNVTFIQNANTLIIGEDTGSGHQNDYIWSYNLSKKELTRIQTTPYGSETTSPYIYNNIGGHGYMMSVVQHPYGEGDALTKEEDMAKTAHSKDDLKAYTGYVGPLPVINK